MSVQRVSLANGAQLLAPNARHRRLVVPAPAPVPVSDGAEFQAVTNRARMGWAERLRRVFDVDVSRCSRCGATSRVLAVITEPRVIAAILAHLEARAVCAPPVRSLGACFDPCAGL